MVTVNEKARYWRRWRSVPRELLFLLLSFPVALPGAVVTLILFITGVGGLVTIFIGVAALIGALYVARGFGTFELVRLEWAGRSAVARPDWLDDRAGTGFFPWLRSVLGNGHYWLYLLNTMIVGFVISLASWVATVATIAAVFTGLTGWFSNDSDPVLPGAFGSILMLIIAVGLVAAFPFITRVLVLMHWAVARGLLGAFRSDALQREVVAANASRGAAISAEGASLRRLERDIHDGPQQRLVRLQMDLAAADRQIGTDPEKARATIAEALAQSREALEELRSLSRGFAPPILMDRGLIAALESAATRSTVPTRVRSSIAPDAALPPEIERNAYFVASEALTNAAKHAGATSVDILVGIGRDTPAPGSGRTGEWLDVRVIDDGRGGARFMPGHGLDGLEERLRGLGGVLTVDSPPGGPTAVSARFPFFAWAPPVLPRVE